MHVENIQTYMQTTADSHDTIGCQEIHVEAIGHNNPEW